MKSITTIVRWLTVCIFILPAFLFFAPYTVSYGETYSGFDMLNKLSQAKELLGGSVSENMMLELILRYIVPLALMLLAGIIFMIRANIGTSIVAVFLSFVSFNMYRIALGLLSEDSIGIGLRISFILSIIGIILPIAAIVCKKINKANEEKNKKIINENQEGEEK